MLFCLPLNPKPNAYKSSPRKNQIGKIQRKEGGEGRKARKEDGVFSTAPRFRGLGLRFQDVVYNHEIFRAIRKHITNISHLLRG